MFKLKQNNTTVRTELVAGITTFMAMAYILMVNAGMFSTLGGDALGASYYNAVYIATALSAVFGTLLIGLLSNLPLAQASGMGLNAFFVYSVCIGMGFTYASKCARYGSCGRHRVPAAHRHRPPQAYL